MENRTTKRMTELIRWHTPPPNLPRYEENIQIKLNAPYHLANPALRTRLDEFVGFLESKDFRPLETFTELTYRYRDLYGEKPPAGLTYVALFVRVATVEELRAAVSAGWTWDKKILTDPGYDCVGNPAKIWTLHHYVDNVQNFRLPERDPMHHYGITRLGTHTEMYACCGQPLSNPGCWMGKEKFKIEPYVMAPSFGALVWDYVVADEWDSIERLWMNPPTRGTMWLYKEKYDAWDQQIRKEKERLKDAIVNAFRAVKNEPSKINPLEHMEPMDRIQFEGLLHLQNRYNAIQCQSSMSLAEFFNLERGKQKLETAKLVIKFDLTRTNSTWGEERQEASNVLQKNGPEIRQMIQDYMTYLDEMGYFRDVVESDIEPELKRLPQFDTLRADPSDPTIREHFNRVIMGDIQYDPDILPDMSDVGDLWKRYEAFHDANVNVGNIDQYPGLLNLRDMPPAAIQDYLNQFWLLDSLEYSGVATDADRAQLQAAQQILEKRPEYVEFMTIKQEGANLVLANPTNDNVRRIDTQLGQAKTIQEATEYLNLLKEELKPYKVPQANLNEAKKWVDKYGGKLVELYERLEQSKSEAEAKAIFQEIGRLAILWLNLSNLRDQILLQKNADVYASLLQRLGSTKFLSKDTLEQFVLEFNGIRKIQALRDQMPGLKQEFPDNKDDLEYLQNLLDNANPLEVEDTTQQFDLRVDLMRVNKEDVWVFDAYNLVETSEQNIVKILGPFIQQTKEAKYLKWKSLREFAKRLKESEFANIVRIFKGNGAEECIDAFKQVLKDIQGKSRSFVERYFGSGRVVMTACLTRLANRWKYLAGDRDGFSLDTFEKYLEGKRTTMPNLYAFFKQIPDISRRECRPRLLDFLIVLENRDTETIERDLVNSREARALLKCMPSGYDQVIEVLEMEPVDVDRLENALSVLPDKESSSARALLDEIDAVDNQDQRFQELSSESEFQDFINQVKLEPERTNYTETWNTIRGGSSQEEESDI